MSGPDIQVALFVPHPFIAAVRPILEVINNSIPKYFVCFLTTYSNRAQASKLVLRSATVKPFFGGGVACTNFEFGAKM